MDYKKFELPQIETFSFNFNLEASRGPFKLQSTLPHVETLMTRQPIYYSNRNDMFMTIERADMENANEKLTLLVQVQILLDDEKSASVCFTTCIIFFKKCITPATSCDPSLNSMDQYYNTAVFTDQTMSKWRETLRLNIPVEQRNGATALFLFSHYPKKNKATVSPFAFSYKRFSDTHDRLPIFKIEKNADVQKIITKAATYKDITAPVKGYLYISHHVVASYHLLDDKTRDMIQWTPASKKSLTYVLHAFLEAKPEHVLNVCYLYLYLFMI